MRTTTFLLAAAFLALTIAPVVESGHGEMKFGITRSGVDAMTKAGAKPDYSQTWVGEWMNKYGWSGFDSAIRHAKERDVTLVVEWYYWGDRISTSCVEYGCSSRTRSEWYAMTRTLADKIDDSGVKAIVVVETEFNKGGVTSSWYAPKMDGYLRKVEDIIREEAPDAEIAIGFGTWAKESWHRFPKAIDGADYVGFQIMGASTKMTKEKYLALDNKAVEYADFIEDEFNKPSIIHDYVMSSYPSSSWEYNQKEAVKQMLGKTGQLRDDGVVGIVWRDYKDNPHMDGYFGDAEKHWGLKRADGSSKSAWWTWVGGIKAIR